MKVFISWSGTKSHKVALVFRDWLPSVIQTVLPYVSSEDIDKGARWSTDIAQELEDSSFGILCVTKENISAPWLSFEAGALSKTMDKSFVSPFLFDIKRSEVHGPILQFQSTIFQKDDIKKLIYTLNKACGDGCIPDTRLERTFEVWYPSLEEDLQKLSNIQDEPEGFKLNGDSNSHTSEILEEILDLSRNNQKLLRNPESKISENIEEIKKLVQDGYNKYERSEFETKRLSKKFHPMLIDEMLHMPLKNGKSHFGFLLALSFFKNDFPWIYDLGKEIIDIIKSKVSKSKKQAAIVEFKEVMEITLSHPMVREFSGVKRENVMYLKELPYLVNRYLENNLDNLVEE